MSLQRLDVDDRQAVMYSEGSVCASTQELVESATFARVLGLYVDRLEAHDPRALAEFGLADRETLLDLIRLLANNPLERVSITVRAPGDLLSRREQLHEFIEGLYDFWRRWDRFLVVRAEAPPAPGDKRPLRGFTETVESLARLVRALYRDVAENVTGTRPRVLRQVAAGAEVGVYAVRHKWPVPARYRELLTGIPFVHDLLLYPPLLLDPPMNTRTGQFTEVEQNPLDGLKLEREEWLCYPALVGRTVVFVYFHRRFMGLGLSLANLFEVASDEEIAAGPDAVYLYGVPPAALARFGDLPTVFHDDRRRPPAGGGGPARGPLRLLRLPQEDGAHAAQRGRHGPRRHALPRRLRPADPRRRHTRHGASHRRHRDRQERDAGGAAGRRRSAASATCASSPTTWARSRSAPAASCSGSAPRSARSSVSTTCSRATRSASSTAPSS